MLYLPWPGHSRKGKRVLSSAGRLIAAFLAILGLTVLGPVVSSASASSVTQSSIEAIQRGWSYVPAYSTGNPELAQGKVLSSSGSPLSQATVILFPVLSGTAAGTVLTPIARTTTDSRGRFTLRLPASRFSRLTSARSEGALNFHLIAFYPGGIAQWFYSLPKATSAPGSATMVLHESSTSNSSNLQGNTISPDVCAALGNPTQVSFLAIMGMKESDATDLANTNFSYGTSNSATLGVGISYTAANVGFTANGSTTQITGLTGTFNSLPSASNNDLESTAIYEDQEWHCATPNSQTFWWQMTQHSVGGASGTPGTAPVPVGHCYGYLPKTTATISNGTQQTFSAGVNLSAKGFGVNLSAQDGWSTQSVLNYTMGNTNGHPVCGQYDFPGTSGVNVGVVGVHSTVYG